MTFDDDIPSGHEDSDGDVFYDASPSYEQFEVVAVTKNPSGDEQVLTTVDVSSELEPLRSEQARAERQAILESGPVELDASDVKYANYRDKFLYAPLNAIKKTFEATTQYYQRYFVTGTHIPQTHKSPFPALNVFRRNEAVATDMIYASTPAVATDGIKHAQLFVGKQSLVADVYGIKSDKHFIRALWDNIRNRGAMDTLMSDSAKAEISEKIQDVCRYLFIKERQSEPKYQHQNPCERRWQNIKHNTTHMMNRFFVPAFCWLLALNYVVYVMNHTAVESLQWRTPIEVLTGQTPDISPILQYRFFEDVYYRNYYAPNTVGGDNERAAWFVGFAENVGHSMTYRVLSKETMELLSVSSLRRAAEGRNLRADDRARLALLGRGLDLNGMKLQQDADGNYVSLDNPEFAFVPSTAENDGRPPPIH